MAGTLLVVVGMVALMLIIKGFLLSMAYDKRKNMFVEPDELAKRSIKEYKKKNQAKQLFKFRDFEQIKQLFEYHLANLLRVRNGQ